MRSRSRKQAGSMRRGCSAWRAPESALCRGAPGPENGSGSRHGALRAVVFAAALAVLLPLTASALVPEPPHLISGAVTVNGAGRSWGRVTLRLSGSPDVIASFDLGTLPGSPEGYLLAVPIDALDPRAPGSARPGDAAQVLLDGDPAAAVTIGERGTQQTLDLALSAPHGIVVIRGPTGTPAQVASGGTVYLDVTAADTVAHSLGYAWAAACPGPDDGAFDDALTRTPVWTAPATGGGALDCSLTVTITDGQGLSIGPSASVAVLPTAAPDPVPQILAAPDPSFCGEQMAFDGNSSFHSNPDRSITRYEWDFDYDGIGFDVDAPGATAVHGYGNRGGPVTVALRVTDNGTPPRSALATREVYPGGLNRPPVADAGGPYAVKPGGVLELNGLGSFDPDAPCGDAIAFWDWDLDADGWYDDAAEPLPSLPWSAAEFFLCGGSCTDARNHPIGLRVTDSRGATATAFSEVGVTPLIFSDDFADGTSKGDPEWQVKSGAWTVLGTAAKDKFYASAPTKGGLSVARAPALKARLAGGIDTKIALTMSHAGYANGAVVFGYTNSARYRYVRLQYYGGRWNLVLGQVGTIGADRGGTKASRTLAGLRLLRWYRLWVDYYDDGRVNVFFNTREAPPAIAYRFKAAAPGGIGYQATRARAYFDDFAAWDRGVLP